MTGEQGPREEFEAAEQKLEHRKGQQEEADARVQEARERSEGTVADAEYRNRQNKVYFGKLGYRPEEIAERSETPGTMNELRELLAEGGLLVANARLALAEKKIQHLLKTAHNEALGLNQEFERLKANIWKSVSLRKDQKKIDDVLEDLRVFTVEKLGMKDIEESSETH